MVDVDRRMVGLNLAHMAGLRRLSARAATASTDRRRRNSSSRDRVLELCRPRTPRKLPEWVERYLGRIGLVLREGGWDESEVEEIVQVSASGWFEKEAVLVDSRAVSDFLLFKAGGFSDTLRRAGWTSDEVSEAFGFHFSTEKEKTPMNE